MAYQVNYQRCLRTISSAVLEAMALIALYMVEIRATTVCLAIVDYDLRNARLKIAASSLTNMHKSKHVNEGRRAA